MQKSFNFNKLLATGMVVGLILLGIAAIYAVRVMELQAGSSNSKKEGNPLIYGKDESELIDNGVPQIPGVKVYSAKRDADQIIIESPQQKLDFKKRTTAKFANKEQDLQIELMRQKDKFAAERLQFLQKIENAKSKEERLRLIEKLQALCKKQEKSIEKR